MGWRTNALTQRVTDGNGALVPKAVITKPVSKKHGLSVASPSLKFRTTYEILVSTCMLTHCTRKRPLWPWVQRTLVSTPLTRSEHCCFGHNSITVKATYMHNDTHNRVCVLVRSRTDQLSEEDKLKEDKPTLTTL